MQLLQSQQSLFSTHLTRSVNDFSQSLYQLVRLPAACAAGRLNGSFKMHCYDAATWHLPSFSGRIHTNGGAFHIWDATDDFSEVAMDLLFEHDRLYMHNAKGFFGAVPMSMTGVCASRKPRECGCCFR